MPHKVLKLPPYIKGYAEVPLLRFAVAVDEAVPMIGWSIPYFPQDSRAGDPKEGLSRRNRICWLIEDCGNRKDRPKSPHVRPAILHHRIPHREWKSLRPTSLCW